MNLYPKAAIFLLLPLLSAVALASQQQASPDIHHKIDKVFEKWDQHNSPGCAIAIVKDGHIVYSRGYGSGNLEYNIPLTRNSVFRVASLSKQFTAACILLLQDMGKLQLQDPVRQYLPGLPDYADQVTIQHLLYHTSGIRDFFQLAEISGYNAEDNYSDSEVMEMIVQQETLNFVPGSEQLYNNSGYFLLAKIIEKVSGLPLRQFARLHIFEPLGMSSTHFHDDHRMIVKNRAAGYAKRADGEFEINTSPLTIIGDGGLFTTVEDLARWEANFVQNRLAISNFTEKMTTRGQLTDGTVLPYAMGLDCGNYRGQETIGHSGAFVGYRSQMLRFPQLGLGIICLANLSSIQPEELSLQVADIYLDHYFSRDQPSLPPAPAETMHKPQEVLISPYIFEPYIGKYTLGSGMIISITNEKGNFYAHIIGQTRFRIFPASESDFFVKETDLEFTFKRNGDKVAGMVMDIGGRRIFANRMENEVRLTRQEMEEYTGNYYNEPLNITYQVLVDKQQLYFRVGNKPRKAVDPLQKDHMIIADGTAAFKRDSKGRIVAFTFNSGEVKNLTFKKL